MKKDFVPWSPSVSYLVSQSVSQSVSQLISLFSFCCQRWGGSRDYWYCGPEGSSLIFEGGGGVPVVYVFKKVCCLVN